MSHTQDRANSPFEVMFRFLQRQASDAGFVLTIEPSVARYGCYIMRVNSRGSNIFMQEEFEIDLFERRPPGYIQRVFEEHLIEMMRLCRAQESAQLGPSLIDRMKEYALIVGQRYYMQVNIPILRPDGFGFEVIAGGHRILANFRHESGKDLNACMREFDEVFGRIVGQLQGQVNARANQQADAAFSLGTNANPYAGFGQYNFLQHRRLGNPAPAQGIDIIGLLPQDSPSKKPVVPEPEPEKPKVRRHIAYRE